MRFTGLVDGIGSIRLIIWIGFLFSPLFFTYAQEATTSSYRLLDPVIEPAEYATTSSFQLWSTLQQIAIGTSTATSFQLNPGFLAFPFVSTPTVSATAGDGQVALSWSASEGFLGWTVGGYTVGRSTTSGGPYAYTSVGAVTSSTRTNLTNGTTYYFVIRVEDALGNFIATSTQVSSTPVAASSGSGGGSSGGSGSGGGGGGGGGGLVQSGANVLFEGRAYPLSTVVVLKDGQIALSTIAGPDARFDTALTGLSPGSYNFALYGIDAKGVKSNIFTFPLVVTGGASTKISGIFVAPTLTTDKSEVKRGDAIAIFGQSAPESDIVIAVHSEQEFFSTVKSDKQGVYLYNFDTTPLEVGRHTAQSKSALQGEISSSGSVVSFTVGTKNVLRTAQACTLRGDLNADCKVNLVDFSIAAFWYKRTLSPSFAAEEKRALNGDGKINLTDFSILAFNWTG